jgi:hypothetical protein
MRLVFMLLTVGFIGFACQKHDSDTIDGDIFGRYTGTFSRTGMDTVPVNFIFKTDNTYEGSSGRFQYPAICGGSFQHDDLSLVVNDSCTWTANFDWTLIFDGNYNIAFNNENSVRIWRTNGTVTDEYILTRFSR